MGLSSIIFLNYFMSEIKEKTEQKSLNDYDTRNHFTKLLMENNFAKIMQILKSGFQFLNLLK